MENRADVDSPQDKLNRIEAPTGDILGEASIRIEAPVKAVFDFWRHLENLPQFMQHVNQVEEKAPGRYTWTVDGPLGTSVSWDAVTTRVVENEVISWQSVEGSEVANSGSVHFTATPTGGTELSVKLAYTPPAGKVGHAVASMFGSNPEQQIQDDLKTLKNLLAPEGSPAAMQQ